MKPPLKPGDYHVMVDGKANHSKIFNSDGLLIRTMDVFPHGENGPRQDVRGGDTVEGLYLLGKPRWTGDDEDLQTVRRPYGWVFIPMGDYEGKEAAVGRDGIGSHGGGRIADYWDPVQVLTYTHGCVRHHNQDARWLAKLVESVKATGNSVWMTVIQ